ncbi:MAG: twin-arginine translocation signal domain-containing protein [Dechloromonas sp.]|nr:MAG: twin-arginine translocation signal domain-containing protein [Dechloromonas sp.]
MLMNRRDFLKAGTAAGTLASLYGCAGGSKPTGHRGRGRRRSAAHAAAKTSACGARAASRSPWSSAIRSHFMPGTPIGIGGTRHMVSIARQLDDGLRKCRACSTIQDDRRRGRPGRSGPCSRRNRRHRL